MYPDFFSLAKRPFVNEPGADYFASREDANDAIARIGNILLGRDSIGIITGGPGVGKTALIARACADVRDEVSIISVDLRQNEPELLYDLMLLGLGADSTAQDEAAALHRLRAMIARERESGRTVSVIIDVNGLNVDRAKRLLNLAHMAGAKGGQLNMILAGPHMLHKLLDSPGLIHMRQRVSFRYRVRPLTVGETDAYVARQITCAGGDPERILAPGIGISLFRFVAGVPRLINTLMDTVLAEGALRKVEWITPELVTQVAEELGWKPLTKTPHAPEASQQAAQPVLADAAAGPEATPPGSEGRQPERATPPREVRMPAITSEDTARLLAATGLLESDDAIPAAASSEKSGGPKPDIPRLGDIAAAGIPEMSAEDTSATGMLKLEDLDAKLAETVFGEDPELRKAFDQHRVEPATD